MSVLVDTNVLLRRVQTGHEHHAAAINSVKRLIEAGEPVHFTLQNISEFWNVMTRPIASNGLGLTTWLVLSEVEKIERSLTLLPDSPATYAEWKSLVARYDVTGVKVHDARLAAIMNVYRIDRILTFNADDFTRFGLKVMHPSAS